MTRTNGLLAGLVILYLSVAGLYAAVIPVFEGFDAQAHFAAVQYFRSERTLPELTSETVARSYELIPHPPVYYALAALAGAGWPLDPASTVARASVNAYFDKSLSMRQSVTLPDTSWQDLAPAWAARFVSALGGLIVLLCTWWLARRLAPRAPTFALAAAAIAAFNPQFLFTAVTISNDAWSAATAALVLAVAVDAVMARRAPRAWLWVGGASRPGGTDEVQHAGRRPAVGYPVFACLAAAGMAELEIGPHCPWLRRGRLCRRGGVVVCAQLAAVPRDRAARPHGRGPADHAPGNAVHLAAHV